MNGIEQIKQAAFDDELDKIAAENENVKKKLSTLRSRHPGVRVAQALSGVGGMGAGIAFARKYSNPKIRPYTTIGGALLGASVGVSAAQQAARLMSSKYNKDYEKTVRT